MQNIGDELRKEKHEKGLALDKRVGLLVQMLRNVQQVYNLQTSTLHRVYQEIAGKSTSVETVHRARRSILGPQPKEPQPKGQGLGVAGKQARERDVPKVPRHAGVHVLSIHSRFQVRTPALI